MFTHIDEDRATTLSIPASSSAPFLSTQDRYVLLFIIQKTFQIIIR